MNATVYNVALSIHAGGTSVVSSSPAYSSGYGAFNAHDGVVTYCNDMVNCPGPYTNKMFKSMSARTTTDVWLQFTFESTKTIRSVYLSLDESETNQHIGLEVRIGDLLETSSLCYKVMSASYSRWISCDPVIRGKYMWIIMPIIDKSLNIIEVMAYEYYFVQRS